MGWRTFLGKLLMVFGVIIVFLILSAFCGQTALSFLKLDGNTREGVLVLSLIQAIVLFILPSLICARIINRKPLQFLALTKAPGWLSVLGVIFAFLIALPALNQIIYWNSNVVFPESLSDWGETLRQMEDNASATFEKLLSVSTFGGMIVNIVIISLLPAIGEELFFRGMLQRTLASSGYVYLAIWMVAILFSLAHLQFFGFVPRMLLGAWFGYLLFWTRSLYVPIIAHFINNGVVVVCAWINARGSTIEFDKFGVVESGFPWAATVSAAAFIVFVVFFRKTFFFSSSSDKKCING